VQAPAIAEAICAAIAKMASSLFISFLGIAA